MILIVGATGHLGGHVARQLLAKGHRVRGMTRTPARASALRAAGAEVVQGDLRVIESVRAAMRGVQTVVSASHAMLGAGKNSSARVDDEGQRTLIDAAKDAGNAFRMADLDNSYMRDQLMLEILLDIRDLFAVSPAAPATASSTPVSRS